MALPFTEAMQSRVTPDGVLVPKLVTEIPTKENGGISEDMTSITWKLLDGLVWSDGTPSEVDAVIWCTGFKPALEHLASLGLITDEGRMEVEGTRALQEPRLWLVGCRHFRCFRRPVGISKRTGR